MDDMATVNLNNGIYGDVFEFRIGKYVQKVITDPFMSKDEIAVERQNGCRKYFRFVIVDR